MTSFVGYTFDQLNWAAVSVGVEQALNNDGEWFEYALGTTTVRVRGGDAERVLVTGMVVTYARSFTQARGSNIGAITGTFAPPESPALQPFHQELLDRRNDLFAHNDKTQWRSDVDVGYLGVERRHVESFTPVDLYAYPPIKRLAEEQRERFTERLGAVEEQLQSASS